MTTPRPHSDPVWHATPVGDVARALATDVDRGHEPEVAEQLLREEGPNRLADRPTPSLLRRLLAQISDVTVLALIGAAIVATLIALLRNPGLTPLEAYGDPVAIMIIVVLNAALGLVQESRAARALAALRSMTSPLARVVRGGEETRIPVERVVRGDLLVLRAGDKVAADARLIQANDLELTEAPLTGESHPVSKEAEALLADDTPLAERCNMVFMATEVAHGRGRALVVSTGMRSELGRIAGMLATIEEPDTPLQRYLNRFGKRIVVACLAISAVVFASGMLQSQASLRELFLTAVSLAVAAIPEGLPAITTIVLALGTQRMARRNALVRKLSAVEGLGSAEVICTDKTGTLTQNTMAARRIYADGAEFTLDPVASAASDGPGGEGDGAARPLGLQREGEPAELADEPVLVELGGLAAHAHEAQIAEEDGQLRVSGNPTDGALRVLGWKLGSPRPAAQRLSETPFSSIRKMATIVVSGADGKTASPPPRETAAPDDDDASTAPRAIVRGAPEVVLALCTKERTAEGERPLDDAAIERLRRVAARWGSEAMRVIALATRSAAADMPAEHLEQELTLVGLVGIVDPPRPEAAASIQEAQDAGITTMMITGDHPATAKAIGRELGLFRDGDLALHGNEIDGLDDRALDDKVGELRIVARATPAHKLRIVEALQRRGRVCAMTGDGVNDAPAVKAAAIGVAMGRAGTEVTKEAADLVLADDNYATIVAAIEEGRAIFSNIRKFILFLLSSNAGIVLTVFAAGLVGWAPPLVPIQILWINLVTNGLPALALGVEPAETGLMRMQPRPPGAPVLTSREYWTIAWVGLVMAAGALGLFNAIVDDPSNALSPSLRQAQTAAFAVLALSPMFHAFNCRSAKHSNFAIGWHKNRALLGAVLVGVTLTGISIYVPVLRVVFRTDPLGGAQLGWLIGAAALPLVLGELAKLLGLNLIAEGA